MNIIQKKDPVFSNMKGLAILSVILGHAFYKMQPEVFVNQYHLAIFFFVAGYFVQRYDQIKPLDFLWKKIKTVFWPFLKYGLIFLLLHNILLHLKFYTGEPYSWHTMLKEAGRLFFPMTTNENLLGPIWFLSALFKVLIVYYISTIIFSFIKNEKKYDIALTSWSLLLYIVGFIAVKNNIPNPGMIWDSFITLFALQLGHLCHQYDILKHIDKWWLCLISILFLFLATKHGFLCRFQTAGIEKADPFIFIPIIIAGVVFIYYLSLRLRDVKILQTIGEMSFTLMIWHFLAFRLVSLLYVYCYDVDFSFFAQSPVIVQSSILWRIAYLFVGLSVPIIIKYLIDKHVKSSTNIS